MEKTKPVRKVRPPETGWARNLSTDNHNGECCGRCHLYNFDEVWRAPKPFRHVDKVAGIRYIIERDYFEGRNGRGMCVEVVLNQYQYDMWHRALLAVGFKVVFTFVNENSNNECRVYLLDTSKMKGPKT